MKKAESDEQQTWQRILKKSMNILIIPGNITSPKMHLSMQETF